MSLKEKSYLMHILQSITNIFDTIFNFDVTLESLSHYWAFQAAFTQAFAQIGENAGILEIPLSHSSEMIGLCNIIVHDYDKVDFTMLWRIIEEDLPSLQDEVRSRLLQNKQYQHDSSDALE